MNPRLIVLTGFTGTEVVQLQIDNGEHFVIGRSAECNLLIGNGSVSRRHCLIRKTDKGFNLEDLESRNGTFLNDLPVRSADLAEGDRITIGNAKLVFLTGSETSARHHSVEFDTHLIAGDSSTFQLEQLETTEFSPDLNTLVKIGKVLNEVRSSELLKENLLDIILGVIPASRGAIVVMDDNLADVRAVCKGRETSSKITLMQLSQTVCTRVMAERVALLSNDLQNSQADQTESLIAFRVAAVLCVPLTIGNGAGLIYLDSNDLKFRFTEDHLQQMTAFSYLISSALTAAESLERLQEENTLLRANYDLDTSLIGDSPSMLKVFEMIAKVAASDSTVLINGESGTGKELVARAIRLNGPRRGKPYTAINCAVLSETLLESELFGHEKGAFTGAAAQKKGKLELTDGGTLFLDEIGELTPSIQAKLLRVLQEREFERVGGTKTIKVDVRIITATNRNLLEEAKKGVFREDLFYRLNVVKIELPPLRDRRSDIPLLAQHFIRKHAEKCSRNVTGLSEKARRALVNHAWHGNVRELENTIERAIVLGSASTIQIEDLPEELIGGEGMDKVASANLHQQLRRAKKEIVSRALEESGSNYKEAADALGIHPNNLHRLIRDLGLKNPTSEGL